MLHGDNLIGVAKTLQDSGLNFSIASEEVRGGAANALWGKYFHDSNLGITLTDSMFNLEYMAKSLGTNVQSGGLSVKEEEVVAAEGSVTLSETAVAFDGTIIGWYKKPTDTDWQIGTIAGKTMTISGAHKSEHYCVKYFYHNENAKSVTIKTQYIPAILHAVLIYDLFAGDVADIGSADRYGRLIVDVPRLQLDGSQDLSLSASGAATTSLAGNALAVSTSDSCEEDPYYGTMTEEIYGAKWQDDVVAIAVENGDVDLEQRGTEDLVVRAVFGRGMASLRKPNSAFTFAVERTPASTASGTSVGAHDGKITAGSAAGACVVSVKLTDNPAVEPAYVHVTVAG